MLRILLYFFIVVGILGVGWSYLPTGFKTQTSALISSLAGGDTQKAKNLAVDNLLPPDPVKERKELISKLRSNLEKIKKETEKSSSDEPTLLFRDNEETLNLLKSSEGIIKQLETASEKESISRSVVDKITDKIFPTRNSSTKDNCPAN